MLCSPNSNAVRTAPSQWRELGWFYALNSLLTATVCLAYLPGANTDLSGVALWSLPVAALSQGLFLNSGAAVLLAAVYFLTSHCLMRRVAAAALYGLTQLALGADAVICHCFHRHFDGVIWGVLTAKGVGESINLGFWTNLAIFGLIVFILGLSCALIFWLAPKLSRFRPGWVLCLLLSCLLWERTVYAARALKDESIIYWVQETLPWYQPLTIRKLCLRLGFKIITSKASTPRPRQTGILSLPKRPIGFSPSSRRPNILFLFSDSTRADALKANVMPNLWEWKSDALWLTNHFSSGHGTGEGIFGALYGIPATYFPRVIAEMKSPPLLDALASLGYDFRILACANLIYPPFRQTAFVHWTNQITDQWVGPKVNRDHLMTDAFIEFLKKEESLPDAANRPFFAFLFYDSAHQPYTCPVDRQLFPAEGDQPEADYAGSYALPSTANKVRKYYDNALHYIDFEMGRILRELKAQGVYDNTIIIVTGDHGEEFGECGRYGHVSDFSHWQTSPLCLVRFPGWKTGTLSRITSHLDFVPSILAWMGATNPISDYSTGCPFNEATDRTFVMCCGWDRYALIKSNSVTVFDRYIGKYFDNDYKSMPGSDPRRPSAEDIVQSMQQMGAFFK
jgi:membrane-anchored protein YejM (alkaline phosphatase superfamily)